MKKLAKILLMIVVALGANCVYAQFDQTTSQSLFSDVKAYKEGDAIMVLIMEDTEADNSASTESGRESSVGGGLEGSMNNSGTNLKGGLNTENDFEGKGRTSRSEKIRSKLSARVVEVEDNGNLLTIEGRRTTTINDETQTIIISGVVRRVDILPNNSVYSYNILDLTLRIEGDGMVSEVQEPGLITKFLRILF